MDQYDRPYTNEADCWNYCLKPFSLSEIYIVHLSVQEDRVYENVQIPIEFDSEEDVPDIHSIDRNVSNHYSYVPILLHCLENECKSIEYRTRF